VSQYNAYVQQGASISDPQANIFAYQANFVPADSSVQIVGAQYDGQHGLPRFILTLHCERTGQQTIVLRWARRQPVR
jgi:hypothetical protein